MILLDFWINSPATGPGFPLHHSQIAGLRLMAIKFSVRMNQLPQSYFYSIWGGGASNFFYPESSGIRVVEFKEGLLVFEQ
jgi:hypothetical protein